MPPPIQTSALERARKGSECPVCGADHLCSFSADKGLVLCTYAWRKPAEGAKPAPPGYKLKGASKDGVSLKYVAVDGDGKMRVTPLDPEEIKRREKKAEEIRQWGFELGSKAWGRAHANHPRVIAYFQARGIEVSELPGGCLPACLRFVERVEHAKGEDKRWSFAPAMIAEVVDQSGKAQGYHLTYLDPGGAPRKIAHEMTKRMLATIKGGTIRLGRDPSRGGVLLTEGIENGATAMAACGLPAWVLGSDKHMAQVKIHPQLVKPGDGPIHTFIICGDANKAGAGERSAALAANVLLTSYPWLKVYQRFPGPQTMPAAFTVEGKWAEGVKGADWNDAGRAVGIEAVSAAIMDGIDLEANGREMRARAEAIARGEASPDSPPEASSAPEGGGGMGGTGAGGEFFGGAGDPPAGGGGSGGGAVGAGGGDEDGEGFGVWRAPDPMSMQVIESGPVQRARRWLWERWRMEGARRFAVARWGGKWWTYTGGCYHVVDEERIQSQAFNWLNGFATLRELKNEPPERKRLNPGVKTAAELLKALVIDTNVDGQTMPRFLPPVISGDGRPLWGEAVSNRHLVGPQAKIDQRAVRQICVQGGRLDLDEICRTGRVELKPHTPDLFSATCLPFSVDVKALQDLLDGRDVYDFLRQKCPTFSGYIEHASGGELRWKTQAQNMAGDVASGDRTGQWIFVFCGTRGTGKTTFETVIRGILGDGNYASPSLTSLGGEFGLAPLVGKSAAIFSDAHLSKFEDSASLIETLKTVSGGGSIQVRDLYESAKTVVLGCRFMIFCNEVPDLRDDSGGLARRLILLPFTRPFDNPDTTAMDRIADELPGILLWAILGAIRLAKMERRRLEMCAAGQDTVDEAISRGAHIMEFVRECMEEDPQGELTCANLYACYLAWCHGEIKREPVGNGRFFSSVRWHLGPNYRYVQPRRQDGSRPRLVKGWSLTHSAMLMADAHAQHPRPSLPYPSH